MKDEKLYDEAKRRVKIKNNFKQYRNKFIVGMLFFTALNLWTAHSITWVKWIFLFWGIGLIREWNNTVQAIKKGSEHVEIEKEAEYLRRKGRYEIEEENKDTIFDMNMNKMKNNQEVMKKSKE